MVFDKLIRWLIYITIFCMILFFFWMLLFKQDYLFAVVALLLIIVACIPLILNLKFKEKVPLELHGLWMLMISFHFFAAMLDLYSNPKSFFTDDFNHLFGGVVLTTIGFFMLLALDNYKEHKLSIPLIGIFAFTFAVTLGVIWEVIEFSLDNVFRLETQAGFMFHNGDLIWSFSRDTMIDLIEDSSSAAITSFLLVHFSRKVPKEKLEHYAGPLRQYLA
ncbi:MAG: hypothetical protein AABW49_03175 [Nanoarchaeota archaeon]